MSSHKELRLNTAIATYAIILYHYMHSIIIIIIIVLCFPSVCCFLHLQGSDLVHKSIIQFTFMAVGDFMVSASKYVIKGQSIVIKIYYWSYNATIIKDDTRNNIGCGDSIC